MSFVNERLTNTVKTPGLLLMSSVRHMAAAARCGVLRAVPVGSDHIVSHIPPSCMRVI